MDLKNGLIALAGAMMFGGGGTQKTSGEGSMNLGESFLVASGAIKGKSGIKNVQPFSTPEMARPRTAGELAAGSRQATKVQLSPQAQLVMNNPKLASKIPQFIQNSTNPQIADFRAKHVSPTLQQGRKTLAPPQPKEIRV